MLTDQRNLIYLFEPTGSGIAVPKPQAAWLQRWSARLRVFNYTIHHVEGELNL